MVMAIFRERIAHVLSIVVAITTTAKDSSAAFHQTQATRTEQATNTNSSEQHSNCDQHTDQRPPAGRNKYQKNRCDLVTRHCVARRAVGLTVVMLITLQRDDSFRNKCSLMKSLSEYEMIC